MAEQVKLVADTRTDSGRSVARRLRANGRVPAVVYGRGVEPTKLHVDARDLYHALHTSAGLNALIRLQVDGDEHLTIAREVQRHPVRGDVLHVDFVALHRQQLIRVEVPIHLEGLEEVASPGVVNHVLHTVPLRVRPLDIPDSFTLSVVDLVIGDVLRVEDIQLPQGAEFDIEEDRTVVTVTAPTVIEAPEEEEPETAAALEPEEAPLAEGQEDAPIGSERPEPEHTAAGGREG
ncbi:MAG: 50S ribosomal protein L25/general stress protein Ctc [Actinobacteria bacterium]|nr:50S ribosomal protein L25/general stress protein Ctc [Actinomycetota bacterium]